MPSLGRHAPNLLVDGHVHFHACFTWEAFLDGAAANFARVRRQLSLTHDSPGCLMLSESAGSNWFAALLREPALVSRHGWRLDPKENGCSIVLNRGPGETLVLVAGRQIVTAERLEVLALGCTQEFPDGRAIGDVLCSVADSRALAVIPWGLGKWMGVRGRILRDLVAGARDQPFCLGDNGGRAGAIPRPALLRRAERAGLLVLGGSDPLPLPDHARRAGSYGFVLDGWRAVSDPAGWIKQRVRELPRSPAAFGGLSSLPAMVRAQIGIRWRQTSGPQAGH